MTLKTTGNVDWLDEVSAKRLVKQDSRQVVEAWEVFWFDRRPNMVLLGNQL
jgi:hypothetical protein